MFTPSRREAQMIEAIANIVAKNTNECGDSHEDFGCRNECVGRAVNAHGVVAHLRSLARGGGEEKPEREMPKVGERVLWLSLEPNRRFEIFPARWGNTHSDRLDWEAGLMFSDLDIALAEKKCAELNEILRR